MENAQAKKHRCDVKVRAVTKSIFFFFLISISVTLYISLLFVFAISQGVYHRLVVVCSSPKMGPLTLVQTLFTVVECLY